MRAIAMTMVVAQHCGLAPFGWTWVWLFYVISGFVITRGFLQERGDEPPLARYGAFMRRRFFRIVPVYLLYVSIGAALCVVAGRYSSLHDLPFLLSFTYNWQVIFQFWPVTDAYAPYGPLWTLSVEEQFYVIFPLIFLFLPRRLFLTATCVLILMGPLIRYLMSSALAALSGGDANFVAFGVYASSFTQFDAFLIGALIAYLEPAIRRTPTITWMMTACAACVLLTYLGVYAAINYANGARGVDIARNIVSGILSGEGREVFLYSVLDLTWAAVVMWAIRRPSLLRPLAWAPVTLVGRISYGGYLYHALSLWIVGNLVIGRPIEELPILNRIPWFLLGWSMSVALAYVSFRWFEKPILVWSKGRSGGASRQQVGRMLVPAPARPAHVPAE